MIPGGYREDLMGSEEDPRRIPGGSPYDPRIMNFGSEGIALMILRAFHGGSYEGLVGGPRRLLWGSYENDLRVLGGSYDDPMRILG